MRFFGSRFFESRFFKSGFFNRVATGDVHGVFNIIEEMDDIIFEGTAERPAEQIADHRDLIAGSPGARVNFTEPKGRPIRGILHIVEEPDRIIFRAEFANRGSITLVELPDRIEFKGTAVTWTAARLAIVEAEDIFEARVETFDRIGYENALLTILLARD